MQSRIISELPELLTQFRQKQLTLLWRGSEHGFGASDFHRHCDGHANTLTLIEDTKGDIFGGFTPVKWESGSGEVARCFKADPTLTSFLFSLKNPAKSPPMKFVLKSDEMERAIFCYSSRGPHFHDLVVSDNCNANKESHTCFLGKFYESDDPPVGQIAFFAGSKYFTVKEIEVFEVTDE